MAHDRVARWEVLESEPTSTSTDARAFDFHDVFNVRARYSVKNVNRVKHVGSFVKLDRATVDVSAHGGFLEGRRVVLRVLGNLHLKRGSRVEFF